MANTLEQDLQEHVDAVNKLHAAQQASAKGDSDECKALAKDWDEVRKDEDLKSAATDVAVGNLTFEEGVAQVQAARAAAPAETKKASRGKSAEE